MKIAMVKHNLKSKGYWFAVPDSLADEIQPGVHVFCDTLIGQQQGTVIGVFLNEEDAKGIMLATGAKFPLREIVAVERLVPINTIKIPKYMVRSVPREEKITKRFLEYYRNGHFNTKIVVGDDGILLDGYTAYKVAKMLHLTHLFAVTRAFRR